MLQSGMMLNKYRIIGKLAAGGMADVYKAEDTAMGRTVALKILPPELARDTERITRFEKEVRHSAALSHPGIVTVYDVGEAEDLHYYTMELLEGGDLKSRIHAGLNPSQAVTILIQLAQALQYAHGKGVIHRDIKPENILFNNHGGPVLTDLGIAKAINEGTCMTRTGLSIGTPHYMSPEQALGKAVDHRSDLYSLGIVFYEMLTGNVPYDAAESLAIGIKHINDPIPGLPPKLAGLQHLIKGLMAKKPEERYQSATQLINAIGRLKAGQELKRPASATRLMPQAAKPRAKAARSRTGSGLKWALGGAFTAILLACGILLFGGRNSQPVYSGGGASPIVQIGEGDTRGMIEKKAILSVSSEPAGAQVLLDDRQIGVTPMTSEDLPPGDHILKLTRKYYTAATTRVHLINGVVVKKNLYLQLGQGDITVLSTPSGAAVTLDGRSIQDKTPLTVTNVRAGKHALTIHLDRYFDAQKSVDLDVGETVRIMVALKGGNLILYQGKWIESEKADKLIKQAREEKFGKLMQTGRARLSDKKLSEALGIAIKMMKQYGQFTEFQKSISAFNEELVGRIYRHIQFSNMNDAIARTLRNVSISSQYAQMLMLQKTYRIYTEIGELQAVGRSQYDKSDYVKAYSTYGRIKRELGSHIDLRSVDKINRIILSSLKAKRNTVTNLPAIILKIGSAS